MEDAIALVCSVLALAVVTATVGWHEVGRLKRRLAARHALEAWERGRRAVRLAVAGFFR